MSAERERVLIAQTKLYCAARLISEAYRELQGTTSLMASHPLYKGTNELNDDAHRLLSVAEQTLKRYP